MSINNRINPNRETKPTIYAYITPTNSEKEGWIKIGYTDRDADVRIKEQTHTAGIRAQKLWAYEARFNGGGYFSDYDFHAFLAKNKIENQKGTEWFYFDGHPEQAVELFRSFVFKDYSEVQKDQEISYQLRAEQEDAVLKALEYSRNHKKGEFLWNAKPRFGKTLAAYDLARRMDANHVLIVTNRPAIANSWYDDFEKFIAWQTDYKFISETDSLKNRSVLSHKEYSDYVVQNNEARLIAFLSLQDLKGSFYFGGTYNKLDYVYATSWDILIIDEAHEGVDTFKTDIAFNKIKRNFTLHLSGTPFRAIAKGNFSEEQIYNWSYADEQEAKSNWDKDSYNPYETLPSLNMFTYQMSPMITQRVNQGTLIGEEEMDFAFDLNEFFKTKDNGDFEHEEEVIKWLDTLSKNEKYPFSTEKLRGELKHTFWVLNRVASAKALEKILRNHNIFKEYKIVIAAGDGKSDLDDEYVSESSLVKVREAIKNNDKTITLSVGQLTTGVTIPEWSAVMILSNMRSPALYMQSAFRAQNPHVWVEVVDGEEKRLQEENAYVFDFAPERTLVIFDEFANNLLSKTSSGGGTQEDREQNIARLINFFPVIGEDEEGKMVEFDATKVLVVPRMLKASEVVKRGFMSNLLFANISGIFQAPQVVLDIFEKLNPESQGKIKKTDSTVDLKDVKTDDEGNVLIDNEIIINKTDAIFGNKKYDISEIMPDFVYDGNSSGLDKIVKTICTAVSNDSAKDIQNFKAQYGLSNSEVQKIERKLESAIEQVATKKTADFNATKAIIEKEFLDKCNNSTSEEDIKEIDNELKSKISDLFDNYKREIITEINNTIQKEQVEAVKHQEVKKENQKKSIVEEDVRSRLRGFSRTIPSFVMAYGKEDLTLANFDSYVPANVFKEVTGIAIDQFTFLRDGGKYTEDGQIKDYRGQLFDETVFNQAIIEFLKKKRELANYFDDHNEDIFDYIPPQKTNQIFTPKNVVKMMVDAVEKENPNIYDDSSKTFIDLYMKSGLYITELVKRLYNSEKIKNEFPDDDLRIKHILENQVYGFAPSEIIYRIAISFIFGNLDETVSRKNFLQIDTTPYVKDGTLQALIDTEFK